MVTPSVSSDRSALSKKHEGSPPDPGNEASPGRSLQQTEIGFIGLGHMGSAMAANLAAAGYRVMAYVRRPDQMQSLAALGLKSTTEFADVFECDIVTSMLPDDVAVHEVVFGRGDRGIIGLASGLKPGAIHLCMSTISTAMASRAAAHGAAAVQSIRAQHGARCAALLRPTQNRHVGLRLTLPRAVDRADDG